MKKSTVRIINLVSVIVIVVMVNLFAVKSSVRIDLTENRAYTLSEVTRQTVTDAVNPITVKVIASPDIPMPYAARIRYFTDMLKRYKAAADGNLTIDIITPDDPERLASMASRIGIPGVQINAIGGDGMSVRTIYMGAVVLMGDERRVLPVIANIGNVEMELTQTIRGMTTDAKKTVAFIDAGGSFVPGRGMSAAEGLLERNFTVTTVRPDGLDDPAIDVAVLAGPRTALNEEERYAVESFLVSGKSLLLLVDSVKADARKATASNIDTGMEAFLEANGLAVADTLVMDARATVVNVNNAAGGVAYQTAVRYPFFPEVIDLNRNHPVTETLQAMNLIFASPVTTTPVEGVDVTELAYTSPKTGIDASPFDVGFQREFTMEDFTGGAKLVAVAVKGTLNRTVMSPPDGSMGSMNVNGPGRMVLVSDAEFANDNFISTGDNARLLQNAVDWLAGDAALVSLRDREPRLHPIEITNPAMKSILRFTAIFLPPLVVVIAGALVLVRRKKYERRG